MDKLREYSSDSESEESEARVEESEVTSERSEVTQTKSEVTHTNSENPGEFNIDNINLYLLRYTQNHHMSSIFISIPWKPSHQTILGLKDFSKKALKFLDFNYNEFYRRYDIDIVGDLTKQHANDLSTRGHHITLGANFEVARTEWRGFVDNFHNAIGQMNINSQLIKHQDDSTLERINAINEILRGALSAEKATTSVVELRFEPTVQLFPSSSSSSLFLGALVRMDPPTKEFLNTLTQLIKENQDLLNVNPQFTIENYQYHMTLARLTVPPHQNKPIAAEDKELVEELGTINGGLRKFDGEYLSSVPLNINGVVVEVLDARREVFHVPFPLDGS